MQSHRLAVDISDTRVPLSPMAPGTRAKRKQELCEITPENPLLKAPKVCSVSWMKSPDTCKGIASKRLPNNKAESQAHHLKSKNLANHTKKSNGSTSKLSSKLRN